jgi:hypothetical protein
MLRRILFTGLLLSLLPASALAQQAGQIVGSITDGKGEAVPGATVKAIEAGTSFARTASTDSAGRYASDAV